VAIGVTTGRAGDQANKDEGGGVLPHDGEEEEKRSDRPGSEDVTDDANGESWVGSGGNKGGGGGCGGGLEMGIIDPVARWPDPVVANVEGGRSNDVEARSGGNQRLDGRWMTSNMEGRLEPRVGGWRLMTEKQGREGHARVPVMASTTVLGRILVGLKVTAVMEGRVRGCRGAIFH
jgi:hypothetical protein